MAAINVKIPDALKEEGDQALRRHDLNATQYITLCWQYLAQHGRPPFMTETRVFTATDLIMMLAGQFADAQSRLRAIRDELRAGAVDTAGIPAQKQELSRLTGDILQNGWRLEALPEETGATGAAYRALPRVNFHLSRCDFALSGMGARLPVDVRELSEFEIALRDFEEAFALVQTVLRDAGALARPAPVREVVYRGPNVTVSIVQPEDYQHGAWLVRLEARSGREDPLEDTGLCFPELEDRVFMPGTVYGKAVRDPQTRKFELGFRFISGCSEFHMYSNGRPDEDNNNSLDKLASEFSGIVDEYLKNLIAEMSERN